MSSLSMSSNLYVDIANKEINIFANNKDILDYGIIYNEIEKQYNINIDEYTINLYFNEYLLTGGIESNNDLLFGNLDSNNELLESKPIYYLQDSIDSKDSTQTLQVFLDSKVLTILHYSILESSLNIKLESKSKEAKKILSKELDYCKAKASGNDNKVIESTAFLCPILEDNEIKCIHGGIVKLKSNKGKNFKSNNKSMILESDLLNSQIIGCQNTILGVPTPCNLIS
ncbi:lipase, partial [Helicobacter saguini]